MTRPRKRSEIDRLPWPDRVPGFDSAEDIAAEEALEELSIVRASNAALKFENRHLRRQRALLVALCLMVGSLCVAFVVLVVCVALEIL